MDYSKNNLEDKGLRKLLKLMFNNKVFTYLNNTRF